MEVKRNGDTVVILSDHGGGLDFPVDEIGNLIDELYRLTIPSMEDLRAIRKELRDADLANRIACAEMKLERVLEGMERGFEDLEMRVRGLEQVRRQDEAAKQEAVKMGWHDISIR